ncbi:MAG TPA: TRAP transporter large permease subunit [Vicinamibacterales bacterium]|nr:TRAP transporter large permease subunit [Vicinamibacterales bacterium]
MSRIVTAARGFENLVATLALAGIMLLPLAEIAMRQLLQRGIPGAGPFTLNLTLWVGLLGAAIGAREGKLLTLATGEFLPKGTINIAHVVSGFAGAAIAMMFAVGGLALVQSEREAGTIVAVDIPVWVSTLAFPIAFTLIALRLAWKATPHWWGRIITLTGVPLGYLAARNFEWFEGAALLPWIVGILIAGVLGTPIFALLGGIAMVAFFIDGTRPIVPLIKAYEELTSPAANLAAIPLFTLTGFFLAEGNSPTRLLRALRAMFGWAPGGTAVAAATLCAFFTLFTGGSGVTILALGGLLLPALIKEGYRERFAIGLLTASGSLGLLFPLSVPLILYAIVAQNVAIEDLFIGGFVPGMLMLGLLAALGVREAVKTNATRHPFRFTELGAALWDAKWEMALPIVVLWALFSGYATTSESAAVAALYALIVQRFVHRDVPTFKDVVRVAGECVALIGGVLVILSIAVGLTNYLVNAQVPTLLIEWTQAHIQSKWAFLLALNGFLLLVGTVMDIFSAIVVVVPLLLPLADAYGINYVHLGVIFIANLELGYLHPPLGLNLLLASYRFKKPVLEVTWATLPMLGILLIGVLLITYVPWLTLGILQMLGRTG